MAIWMHENRASDVRGVPHHLHVGIPITKVGGPNSLSPSSWRTVLSVSFQSCDLGGCGELGFRYRSERS